jgi:hypothetical protein
MEELRPQIRSTTLFAGVARRREWLAAALLISIVKSIEFAIDSQTLFWYDSGAFMLNAMGLAFIPMRSYLYAGLIRMFALPFHWLPAVVAMQLVMGGLTAWLLAFALIRFLRVRPWIGILAALVFAADPVQVVYEHMVMAETATMLAMAVFLVVALQYLQSPSFLCLAALSCVGGCLVGLRIVYLPVVLVSAVLLPLAPAFQKKPRWLAMALAVSCLSTFCVQTVYRHLTGRLAHREPAYHYSTGLFLLSTVTPIVEPDDSKDSRVAAAIRTQQGSGVPMLPGLRVAQQWAPEGLIAKIRSICDQNERCADETAHQIAKAAIRRNPLGFLELGAFTYRGYWSQIGRLREMLEDDNGLRLKSEFTEYDRAAVLSAFSFDFRSQREQLTPSRRYHLAARNWQIFLLLAPFLLGLALILGPANPRGVALLFLWSFMVLGATCLGATESLYRYLHPFSFLSLAASALLLEKATSLRHRSKPRYEGISA